jgi:tetratricopeptide (TPR) repeat protein
MSGKWADAEQYFGAALAADPRDPQIVAAYLNELGEKSAKKALGEAAQKKKLASEAKRLLPAVRTNARAVMAVSQALLIADLGEDAWKVAMESLRLIDSPSIIKYQLGKVSARAGLNLEEGLSYLDQAANEPLEGGIGGYASVHWRRGQILKALGRADEARAAANRALSFDSRHKGARELLNSL